jgi:hypothetical protein
MIADNFFCECQSHFCSFSSTRFQISAQITIESALIIPQSHRRLNAILRSEVHLNPGTANALPIAVQLFLDAQKMGIVFFADGHFLCIFSKANASFFHTFYENDIPFHYRYVKIMITINPCYKMPAV